MSHSCNDPKGLHCSCCNPLWKALIPNVDLSKLYEYENEKEVEKSQSIIFTTLIPENIKAELEVKSEGYIQTMEGGKDVMEEAVGIKDGLIKAVGSYEDVKRIMTELNKEKTETVIEKYIYNGQTLLPGFFEPHIHIIPSAVVDMATNVGPFIGQELRSNVKENKKEKYTREWVIKTLKDKASKCTAAEIEAAGENENNVCSKLNLSKIWIFGRNVDPSLLIGDKKFDADELEKVSSVQPVFLMNSSMHLAYLNKVAVGIVNNYNKANNKPEINNNGILVEETEFVPVLEMIAKNYFLKKPTDTNTDTDNIPKDVDPQDKLQLKDIDKEKAEQFILFLNKKVDAIFENASARGVTYVFDAGVEPSKSPEKEEEGVLDQPQYLKKKANDNCRVRIGGALIAPTLEDYNEKIEGKYHPNTGDDQFNLAYVKVITDGSNQGLTGYQKTPYDCNGDYLRYGEEANITEQTNIGVFNYGYPLELNALVSKAVDANWPVMVHANGDHALDRTINAFKQAGINKSTVNARRDRIEHASLLSNQNLEDMKELGVSPSFLIGHVGYWGWVFQQTILGQERSSHLDRCHSAINDYDMRITLHSDYGVSPIGPLRMMEQSITRIMEGAPEYLKPQVLNEAERITRFQALKAMTYDAAWQCHADKWAGSLEKDKCADFVLLERNPLTYSNKVGVYSAKGMRDIRVLETWKGGTLQHQMKVKSIKVLDNNKEIATLTATYTEKPVPEDLVFRYENTSKSVKPWGFTYEEVVEIVKLKKVSVYEKSAYVKLGKFDIGHKKDWLYSHDLWETPEVLKAAIYDLLKFSLTEEDKEKIS
jgi:predicted amidohydrolase YtcJ